VAGHSSSTLSIASVLAAQAYVAARPAPAPRPAPLPLAATAPLEVAAPVPAPTDGTVTPVGDARRARHWSALGAARRAVL